MKIAVSGKGGVGKTFIAASLAARFAESGHAVIAIDADTSPNLAFALGLRSPDVDRILPVAENDDLIRLKTGTPNPGVFRLTFSVDDIIRSTAILTPSGAYLLVMGTVRAPGAGCACPAHAVIKALLRHLIVERDEIVILDMEAGIEHLGRGTASHVDLLLIVADANLRSLEVAATIARLARAAEIPRIALIGNRVTGEVQRRAIESFAKENGIGILSIVPFDEEVVAAGMTGNSIRNDRSVAVPVLTQLADQLLGQTSAGNHPGKKP